MRTNFCVSTVPVRCWANPWAWTSPVELGAPYWTTTPPHHHIPLWLSCSGFHIEKGCSGVTFYFLINISNLPDNLAVVNLSILSAVTGGCILAFQNLRRTMCTD
jgi:hypothetical protein